MSANRRKSVGSAQSFVNDLIFRDTAGLGPAERAGIAGLGRVERMILEIEADDLVLLRAAPAYASPSARGPRRKSCRGGAFQPWGCRISGSGTGSIT